MINKEYIKKQLSIVHPESINGQEHRNEIIKLNLLQMVPLVFLYVVFAQIPAVHIDLPSLDLSYRFYLIEIFYNFALYIMLVLNLNILGYNDSVRISELIVSTLAGWYFVYSSDIQFLVSYYWYDLILSVRHRDIAMIAHHLFTIWGVSHTEYYPDYYTSILTTQIIKRGDVLLHVGKIIKKIFIKPNKLTHWMQLITAFYTAVSMSYHRLYLIYFVNYQLVSVKAIMILFTCLSSYWIFMVYRAVYILIYRLKPIG